MSKIIRFPVERARPDLKKGKGDHVSDITWDILAQCMRDLHEDIERRYNESNHCGLQKDIEWEEEE